MKLCLTDNVDFMPSGCVTFLQAQKQEIHFQAKEVVWCLEGSVMWPAQVRREAPASLASPAQPLLWVHCMCSPPTGLLPVQVLHDTSSDAAGEVNVELFGSPRVQ